MSSLRIVLLVATTLASFMALCGAAAWAATPSTDAVTERVREILRKAGGDSEWGAEPPAEEIAARGEPFAATTLTGVGHAMILIDSEGRLRGSHLRLMHVKMEGARASVSECELRLGPDEDRSCPPAPFTVVDCATWSVPSEDARAAMLEARAALFVRVYEKTYISGPREEVDDGGVPGGVMGGISGGTSADFAVVANVMESGEHPIRVAAEWAGYVSADASGRYARVDAATDILREAFPRPSDAPASTPPPGVHAEFSRLFSMPPLERWWVHERMVLMATTLGLPADLARLEGYLTSNPRTRAYALEALARRTGRDTRCDGSRRLSDAAAAAAWRAATPPNPRENGTSE
ncbi:MAG TPA: hypothetical protein VNW71_14770 [Thermoanaerobaculia bacterium]|nr:hypothetical protein [Thermoanaerobaculia bacterium]